MTHLKKLVIAAWSWSSLISPKRQNQSKKNDLNCCYQELPLGRNLLSSADTKSSLFFPFRFTDSKFACHEKSWVQSDKQERNPCTPPQHSELHPSLVRLVISSKACYGFKQVCTVAYLKAQKNYVLFKTKCVWAASNLAKRYTQTRKAVGVELAKGNAPTCSQRGVNVWGALLWLDFSRGLHWKCIAINRASTRTSQNKNITHVMQASGNKQIASWPLEGIPVNSANVLEPHLAGLKWRRTLLLQKLQVKPSVGSGDGATMLWSRCWATPEAREEPG